MSYTDDPTISDSEELWRRVPRYHFVIDENLGAMRPSSAAFSDSPDGSPMPVCIASICETPSVALGSYAADGYALAGFLAGLARQLGQGIQRDPLQKQPS